MKETNIFLEKEPLLNSGGTNYNNINNKKYQELDDSNEELSKKQEI